jgi:hypothetical protein
MNTVILLYNIFCKFEPIYLFINDRSGRLKSEQKLIKLFKTIGRISLGRVRSNFGRKRTVRKFHSQGPNVGEWHSERTAEFVNF